jgi:(1->4)-alpha-D-glucan 1-alpha-D-glucosylmutase
LLHFAVPGVPDIYQGDEIADLSLVDPDNRRPVDYDLRRNMLQSFEALLDESLETQASALRAMLAAPQDGKLKLWVTWKALKLRQQQPELFARGDYVAVTSTGQRARHVVAFARRHDDTTLIVIAGRMFAQMELGVGRPPIGEQAWVDTALELPFLAPQTRLVNVLSGEAHGVGEQRLALSVALGQLPVAMFLVEKPPMV